MKIKEGIFETPQYDLRIGKKFYFQYHGATYLYRIGEAWLYHEGGDNLAILEAIQHHTGIEPKDLLQQCYGYSPVGGIWPQWKSHDTQAVHNVFKLLSQCGVNIVPYAH